MALGSGVEVSFETASGRPRSSWCQGKFCMVAGDFAECQSGRAPAASYVTWREGADWRSCQCGRALNFKRRGSGVGELRGWL